MNNVPWRDAEFLPSVQRFLGDVADSFDNGQNVVVLLPPTLRPTDVCDWLHSLLDVRDVSADRVDIATWNGAPASAHAFFNTVFDAALGAPRPLAQLFREPACPRVLILSGLATLPAAAQKDWLDLIEAWAKDPLRLDRRLRACVLCLVETAARLPRSPTSDAGLAVRHWWGLPSSLELRTHCRALDQAPTAQAAWHESLVAGVAPGDISLAEHVWKACPTSVSELRACLCAYAQQHGLGTAAVKASTPAAPRGGHKFATLADRPRTAQLKAWQAGHLIGSQEFGEEVHPYLLACEPFDAPLEHLLWRGQQQILFPAVDRVRLAACGHLVTTKGVKWHERFIDTCQSDSERDRLKEGPLSAEFGTLCHALARGNGTASRWDGGQSGEAAAHGRSCRDTRAIRDQLAHYRALNYEQFRLFWELVRS